jgi:hypothetical protein
MKIWFGKSLLFVAALVWADANAQQPAANSVDGHMLAAQKAAGLEFPGLLSRLCVVPPNKENSPPPQPPSATPRPAPDRSNWYAPPVKVFDNLYWVGTMIHSSWALKTSDGIILIDTLYNYASEPEIVDGLRKLGLDPATVKYVIVSHGHGDHDEGANLMQQGFHSHIIMAAPDWDAIEKANNMPGGDAEAGHGRDRRRETHAGRHDHIDCSHAWPYAGNPRAAVPGQRPRKTTERGLFRRHSVQ